MRCVPRLYTNLHVQAETPVMSVKPPDILGLANICFRIVIPISIEI